MGFSAGGLTWHGLERPREQEFTPLNQHPAGGDITPPASQAEPGGVPQDGTAALPPQPPADPATSPLPRDAGPAGLPTAPLRVWLPRGALLRRYGGGCPHRAL